MANDATVHAIGNLIKDPTHNTTRDGQTVVSFTVAVNTTLKKEGAEGYESNFYNLSVFGKKGEYLLDQIQKGTQVYFEGDLQCQNYESKNGVKGQSLNVNANKVRVLARRKAAPERPAATDPDDRAPF